MTLVLSTSHEVRPQVAVFTKQRDNTKRSQRLRCYRRRHEYSKTRGSRVSGRRSIAPRREWSDRHSMNRKPSLIDLARAASGRRSRRTAGAGAAAALLRRAAPAEVTFPPNMAARRKCAAYLSGRLHRLPPCGERNARTRMRRFRYPQKCARSPTYE